MKELTNQLLRHDRHNAKVDGIIGKFGGAKREHAVEWAQNSSRSGGRVAVLTYLRSTAQGIAARLRTANRGKYQVFHFDGATTIKKRREILDAALKAPKSILVCTMASVKEGINTMAGFDEALLAELYYTPGMMSQVLGRFHRLSGACNVSVLVFEGSWEEIIAFRLQDKMRAAGMLQRNAVAEEALDAALEDDETEEEAFETLRSMAADRVEDDIYA